MATAEAATFLLPALLRREVTLVTIPPRLPKTLMASLITHLIGLAYPGNFKAVTWPSIPVTLALATANRPPAQLLTTTLTGDKNFYPLKKLAKLTLVDM